MKAASINPYTEETNKEFDLLDARQCDEAVERARKAFSNWRKQAVAERVKHLQAVASKLRENKRRYAELITIEMGKPIKQSVGEIEKCAWLCDYYAENSVRLLQNETVSVEFPKSYIAFDPLGVILGIMPWNFPFWQVFRFAVPAMAAGNVCLLKHASNVPMTALEIEKIFSESGFPPHVFQTLLIDSSTAARLIEEDKADGVSLTGSVEAGSKVGALAGGHIKKLVLELGGSDPFIVLDDADIEKAAETAVMARTMNAGQSCIAAKRFIVMEGVADAFRDCFVKHLNKLKIGDPMLEDTDMGPLAAKEFIAPLHEQLEDARAKGAEIIYGPKTPEGKGCFFQPAVVSNLQKDMKVLTEEVFGPIAPILSVGSEEEIVRIANATEFGLGASIWSKDIQRAEALARDIDAGFIAINDMVKSDPGLPFGGVKKSGVGRELSYFGLKEFVNIKTVVVRP